MLCRFLHHNINGLTTATALQTTSTDKFGLINANKSSHIKTKEKIGTYFKTFNPYFHVFIQKSAKECPDDKKKKKYKKKRKYKIKRYKKKKKNCCVSSSMKKGKKKLTLPPDDNFNVPFPLKKKIP